jgi:hypothetical protein
VVSDTAHWKPDKGWGGDDHRYDRLDDFDDFSDLDNDPVLAAQLAEDAEYDDL